jgi:hypothetical protein
MPFKTHISAYLLPLSAQRAAATSMAGGGAGAAAQGAMATLSNASCWLSVTAQTWWEGR